MSHFIVTYDYDFKDDVLDAIASVPSVVVSGRALRNGTVKIKTTTRDLDAEANAVHAIEDIQGVLDVRLIQK